MLIQLAKIKSHETTENMPLMSVSGHRAYGKLIFVSFQFEENVGDQYLEIASTKGNQGALELLTRVLDLDSRYKHTAFITAAPLCCSKKSTAEPLTTNQPQHAF